MRWAPTRSTRPASAWRRWWSRSPAGGCCCASSPTWRTAAWHARTCTIPLEKLAFDNFSAEEVRDGIIAAWAFAAADPYRAATHNKGIMNGVDAVVIATGNDWRAVEAGAHAYAARSGRYTSLSTWGKDEQGNLVGTLEMPMAVGIVGGATRVHPAARAALKLMGVNTAAELAEIIVSVGLAQNLAALRALATEGIQRGHMSLHARQVAIAAGAQVTRSKSSPTKWWPRKPSASTGLKLLNELKELNHRCADKRR